MHLAHLSDAELLSSLSTVCLQARQLLAHLLVHLIEVERRQLDLGSACSSLYDFCQRRLGMSENEAVRRIEAARLVKRFPVLLEHLQRGHIHLTAMLLIRRHVTEDNVEELVEAVRGKTKDEVLKLLAARAPRSDVMPTITPLPGGSALAAGPAANPALGDGLPSPAKVSSSARIEPLSATRHRLELTIGDDVRAKLERARDLLGHRVPDGNLELVIDRALDALLAKLEKERLGKSSRPRCAPRQGGEDGQIGKHGQHREDRQAGEGGQIGKNGQHGEDRQAGEDGQIGKNGQHGEDRQGGDRRKIPQAVRRAVFERDGERCTFIDADGNRCNSRERLELDHIVCRAHGGEDTALNLHVRCRPHNLYLAVQALGRAYVERRIRLRQRRSSAALAGAPKGSTQPPARAPLALEDPATAHLAPVACSTSDPMKGGASDSACVRSAPPIKGATAATRNAFSSRSEQPLDVARRALTRMGFRDADVRRALVHVGASFTEPPPLTELLKSAIAVLTR